MGIFWNFFNNISEHVTLLHLLDTVMNVNIAASITGNCIFNSNDEKELRLEKYSFDLIWYSSNDEDIFAMLETVYYEVRHVNTRSILNISEWILYHAQYHGVSSLSRVWHHIHQRPDSGTHTRHPFWDGLATRNQSHPSQQFHCVRYRN